MKIKITLDGAEVREIVKQHVGAALTMDLSGKEIYVSSSYSGYEYEVTIEDPEEPEEPA